jgi:hypothetical protein
MYGCKGVGNDFVGIAHGGYLENLKFVHEGHETNALGKRGYALLRVIRG